MKRLSYVLGLIGAIGITALAAGGNLIVLPDEIIFRDGFENHAAQTFVLQEAYVKASNTDADDLFGGAVALSGDGHTLAVGAQLEASAATGVNGDQADNSRWKAGAAYVYTRDSGGLWTQQAYIKAAIWNCCDQFGGDLFGTSVALSDDGNTLAIGAILEDSAATGVNGDPTDNTQPWAGAAYVFTRDGGGVWTQQAYVKASNTGADDNFGGAVALSGDGHTLAVGAYKEDSAATGVNGDQADNSAGDAGAVYVYTRDTGGVWTQQAYVKASNTEALDYFGGEVALSGDGNMLAVAAHSEDSAATGVNGDQADNSASGAGAAYVYTRDGGGVWTQQAYVKASNTEASDLFGRQGLTISDDGNTLAVGAPWEDSAATGLNGDQTDNSAIRAGAAYVYTRDSGGVWTQQAYVKASNTGAEDAFGRTITLSADGNIMAVSSFGEESAAIGVNGDQADNSAADAGAVYVFTRDTGGVWTQQAYVKASNTEALDYFGSSGITLSDDGNIMAVSAVGEDSAATGVNGDQTDNSASSAGAVYVFNVSPVFSVASLADLNSNGSPDLAVLREGSILAEVRDGQAGALLNQITFLSEAFTPIAIVALPDADGNGVAELAVLATRNSDGRIVAEIRNLTGAEAPRFVWFAANHTPVTIKVIDDDADNNGVVELAVLSTRDSDGRIAVEVKNAFGPTNPNTVWYMSGNTPVDLEIVPDKDSNGIPEVAVLSFRNSDGRIVTEVKNAAGATNPTAVWFMPGNTAIDLVAVDDKDANGISEVAVLSSCNSDGCIVVEVKNVTGPTSPNTMWYSSGFTAHGLATIADTDSNGIEEALVLMIRDSDGRILVHDR